MATSRATGVCNTATRISAARVGWSSSGRFHTELKHDAEHRVGYTLGVDCSACACHKLHRTESIFQGRRLTQTKRPYFCIGLFNSGLVVPLGWSAGEEALLAGRELDGHYAMVRDHHCEVAGEHAKVLLLVQVPDGRLHGSQTAMTNLQCVANPPAARMSHASVMMLHMLFANIARQSTDDMAATYPAHS